MSRLTNLAKSVLKEIAREQDWGLKQQLEAVLDFIDENDLVDELENYLTETQQEEGAPDGNEEESEEDEEDD